MPLGIDLYATDLDFGGGPLHDQDFDFDATSIQEAEPVDRADLAWTTLEQAGDVINADPYCPLPASDANREAEDYTVGTAAVTRSETGTMQARTRISATQWENVRPIIERVYMEEGKSLAVTRKVLEDEHHFRAS